MCDHLDCDSHPMYSIGQYCVCIHTTEPAVDDRATCVHAVMLSPADTISDPAVLYNQ